jgi:hypothetical protein
VKPVDISREVIYGWFMDNNNNFLWTSIDEMIDWILSNTEETD